MTEQPPAVSVLTTAYNAAPFIHDAIESVVQQKGVTWEMLIVDDASQDETASLVSRLAARDARIRLLQNGKLGRAGALNYGLECALGTYIAVLDADDVALPGRLAAQADAFTRDPRLTLYGTGHFETTLAGVTLHEHRYPTDNASLQKALEVTGRFFSHSASMFPRRTAAEIGGYRTRFTRSMDWDMFLRLSERGTVRCHAQPLIKLRRHGGSLSSTGARTQKILGMAGTISHLRRRAGESDPVDLDDEAWAAFLKWLEGRLEQLGYFREFDERAELRDALAHFAGERRRDRGWRYLKTFMRWRTYRTLLHRFTRTDFAPLLAREYRWLHLDDFTSVRIDDVRALSRVVR